MSKNAINIGNNYSVVTTSLDIDTIIRENETKDIKERTVFTPNQLIISISTDSDNNDTVFNGMYVTDADGNPFKIQY